MLASSYRSEARRRGIAEGRSEAALIAHTAVEPLLDGHPLAERALDRAERAGSTQLVRTRRPPSADVLRLRLRDLDGTVVFSDDGSGFGGTLDDEAVEAARRRDRSPS